MIVVIVTFVTEMKRIENDLGLNPIQSNAIQNAYCLSAKFIPNRKYQLSFGAIKTGTCQQSVNIVSIFQFPISNGINLISLKFKVLEIGFLIR